MIQDCMLLKGYVTHFLGRINPHNLRIHVIGHITLHALMQVTQQEESLVSAV